MALFDDIQAQLAQPKKQAVPSYQAIAQKFLAAKSGKAAPVTGTGPAASSLGEKTAVAAVQQPLAGGLDTAALQAQAGQQRAEQAFAAQELSKKRDEGLAKLSQAEALGATERQAGLQSALSKLNTQQEVTLNNINSSFQKAVEKLASDKKVSTEEIWRGFKKGKEDLAARKDAAELEQAGFSLALRDKAYLQTLSQVAEENNLKDDIDFRRELNRLQNDGNEQLANMQASWYEEYQKNEQDFLRRLADISLDSAWDLYTSQAKAANEAQVTKTAAKGAAMAYDYSQQKKA